MQKRQLAAEEVALLHHVELTDAGWQDRFVDQLVTASVLSASTPIEIDVIRKAVTSLAGQAIASERVDRSVNRLVSSKVLLEVSSDRYSPSQKARADAEERLKEATDAEVVARRVYEAHVQREAPDAASTCNWTWFCETCLQPLISAIGARTYELLTPGQPNEKAIERLTTYLEHVPASSKLGVRRAIEGFFSSADVAVRRFVLLHLHAHLLGLAANLPSKSLSALQDRVRAGVQLKIFLDTNFLFSLLGLHENPSNESAIEFVSWLSRIKDRVKVVLYVMPLTVDEVRRTLGAYQERLGQMVLTARLGSVATVLDGELSGITVRYLEAVRGAKHRLSAKDYFDPYLSNLIGVLRSRGVELYNERVDDLSQTQPVIDDILEQQEFEKRRFGPRAKSYEALRHDITLWHLAAGRRPSRLDAPLDALFWVATVDYRLLGFDAHKRGHAANSVPVCVHPTVLVQMLQLWVPRSPELDAALFHSLRALLPHFFDAEAEEMSLRILRALSRFEDVDDLPEETITSLLLNKALRQRMSAEPEVDAQIKLVRDAIVDEVAETRAELERERDKTSELAERLDALSKEKGQLQATVGSIEGERVAERQRLEKDLEGERGKAAELADRLSRLEATVADQNRHLDGLHQRDGERRVRTGFGISVIGLGVLLGFAAWASAIGIHRWLTYSQLRSALLSSGVAVAVWLTSSLMMGRAKKEIRSWIFFQSADRVIVWLRNTAWVVALGLLANLIFWELSR